MNHKQLIEPDHAEDGRGEREESDQPLLHQLQVITKMECAYNNDPNERFLLLRPGCPVPHLR